VGLVSSYKKTKGHKVTVVFDGALNLSEFANAYVEQGVRIIFSPETSSADAVIKEMVNKEGARITVVTSDRDILLHAENHGAATISSPEFYERLIFAKQLNQGGRLEDDDDEKPLHKRWLTKKKGPAKRLPKKERRNRQKIDKL
jgi:predicted RNA-binding protein with PIN domain